MEITAAPVRISCKESTQNGAAPRTFERPFPALTPAQRLHLEVNGYVVVQDVFSSDECGVLREALQKLKHDLRATGDPKNKSVRGARAIVDLPHHIYMSPLLRADPSLAAYATHPRIVGMAEELIGGEARLAEFNAHANSRDPNADLNVAPRFPFHTGIDVPFGNHTNQELYHCLFVKALTNLTDLGPDDGGTVVVAGSHKLNLPTSQLVEAAYADRSLIHQVIAPAGSTLLFSETLIHATNQIRSDRERYVIIAGYSARMMPMWSPQFDDEFAAKIPEHLQTLLLGKNHWTRAARYRDLSEPIDPRKFTLADGWHAPSLA